MDSKIDGTKYYYSVQIAKEISLEAAVIFIHLCVYVDYAQRKQMKQKYHDGLFWTYASRKSINDKIPYISQSNIYRALCALIEHGYIMRGNFNKTAYDRTYWYTITPKGWAVYRSNPIKPIVNQEQSIDITEHSIVNIEQSNDLTGVYTVNNEPPIPIHNTIHRKGNHNVKQIDRKSKDLSKVQDFFEWRYSN